MVVYKSCADNSSNAKSPASACSLGNNSCSLSVSSQPLSSATASKRWYQTFHLSIPVKAGNLIEWLSLVLRLNIRLVSTLWQSELLWDSKSSKSEDSLHDPLSICCLILHDLATTDLLELLVILLDCLRRLHGDFRSRSLSLDRLPFINAVGIVVTNCVVMSWIASFNIPYNPVTVSPYAPSSVTSGLGVWSLFGICFLVTSLLLRLNVGLSGLVILTWTLVLGRISGVFITIVLSTSSMSSSDKHVLSVLSSVSFVSPVR